MSTVKNYVALVDGSISYLFLLANICGVAIKFRDQKSPERVDQYTFPLPQLERERLRNTRLWDCGGTLHISGYASNGLWIWKHRIDYASTTQADTWSWISLRKINTTDFIVEAFLGVGHSLRPLACHPDVAVMYLVVNSSVFAYDLTNGTLDKITNIHNPLDNDTKFVCFPFKPCLSSLNVSKISDIDDDYLEISDINNLRKSFGFLNSILPTVFVVIAISVIVKFILQML